jgi:tetratricopeptide (TPR) repeat protein
MKSLLIRMSLLASVLIIAPAGVRAAEGYGESLRAGDAALAAGKSDVALQEFESAVSQSKSDGERSLALGKKGYVLAFAKQDYAKAREAAEKALEVEQLAPVARVTGLQVLSQCQMKADKDFVAAQENLEKALALEGVDWAKPALALSLGDCYRSNGNLDKALETYQSILAMEKAAPNIKAGAHLCSGFIYHYDRKDADAARKCYASAVSLRPDLKKEVDGHLGRLQ